MASRNASVVRLLFKNLSVSSSRHPIISKTAYNYSTVHKKDSENPEQVKNEGISKAMAAYLQRAKEHDDFMKEQRAEFEIGKKHLANMMGQDVETYTQKEIDEAIEYLLPSGLYDKKARPMMKPPEEIYPKRKAAQFDASGRPHSYLFYTARPYFYQLMHDSVKKLESLNQFEDKMIRKQVEPDNNQALELSGFEILSKEKLEAHLLEPITDTEYNQFVKLIDRICDHPYSYKLKDFIYEYKKPLVLTTKVDEIKKPETGEDGRLFVTELNMHRKSCFADVTVRSPGTGKMSINGQDISYFKEVQPREQVLFPLLFTDMVHKVDVEATTELGGFSGQAGAIRLGIARCLRSFVDENMIEQMRLAGLLQRDYRRRERKKPGQAGARRKYTWKKR